MPGLLPYGSLNLTWLFFALAVISVTAGYAAVAWLRQRELVTELRAAFDSAAVMITREHGEIVHWSLGCERLYGICASEAIGRDRNVLLPPLQVLGTEEVSDDLGSVRERRVVQTGREAKPVSVIERTTLLERRGKAPLHVVKLLEISDRLAAEQGLRDCEARLQIATEAHGISVFEWDVLTDHLSWSAGSELRLGMPVDNMKSFAAFGRAIPPQDLAVIDDRIAEVSAQQGEHFKCRFRVKQASGEMRVFDGFAGCFYDPEGTLLRMVGVNVDITDAVRNLETIEAREAQLASILETAPSAMVVADAQGLIRRFSKSAEHLWGWSADEIIGQSITLLASEQSVETFQRIFMRTLAVDKWGVGARAEPAVGHTQCGQALPLEISSGRADTREGVFVTLFFRDVSERNAAEQRLSELGADLAHVSRQSAMSEVAADLAHELNQPLSAAANALAATRILVDRDEARNGGDKRIPDLLRLAEEQTLRSGDIIRRLRDFMTKRDAEISAESLDEIVHDAVELVLLGTSQSKIRLNISLDATVDLVFVDKIQIQQVVVNLLRNAMEALRDHDAAKRCVTISSHPVGDAMVELAIEDTGPGFPAEIENNLHSRFATTKDGKSMGIGLSIGRRIVEAHGGALTIVNRSEGGASVRFSLPLVDWVS